MRNRRGAKRLEDVTEVVRQGVAGRALLPRNGAGGRSPVPGGSLGDALRNLQRFVPREQFDNPGGSGGGPYPEIQFDSKGVEFGPWIRRFIAQVKRNWFVPYSSMSMRGHVVITFNVHKDGTITDLTVVGPCPIEAFNTAAFGVPANGTWGNAGRNLVRGPWFWQADTSLSRDFHVNERFILLFRAEAFNVFNRAQFGNPNSNFSSANFGQITTTVNGTSPTGSGTPRQFQFAMRVRF